MDGAEVRALIWDLQYQGTSSYPNNLLGMKRSGIDKSILILDSLVFRRSKEVRNVGSGPLWLWQQ